MVKALAVVLSLAGRQLTDGTRSLLLVGRRLALGNSGFLDSLDRSSILKEKKEEKKKKMLFSSSYVGKCCNGKKKKQDELHDWGFLTML